MIIIKNINSKKFKDLDKHVCLTIGMFDGFHKGHQGLIKDTIELSKKYNAISGIFTFQNHPLSLLAPSYSPISIMTPMEKQNMAKLYDIQLFCQISFSHQIADLNPEDFVYQILKEKLNVCSVSVGFNFRFGKDGIGNTDLLKQLGKKNGFNVSIINPVLYKDKLISSTSIREMIESGDVEYASELLTRPHSIRGVVVSGFGRGRKLGFPTANLKLDHNIIIPNCGVYAVLVKHNNKIYGGMMNIGFNPTFDGKSITLEVHLFDFNKNLNGEPLRVHFIKRMRDELKFTNVEDLKKQLHYDYYQAKDIISKIPKQINNLCKKIKI